MSIKKLQVISDHSGKVLAASSMEPPKGDKAPKGSSLEPMEGQELHTVKIPRQFQDLSIAELTGNIALQRGESIEVLFNTQGLKRVKPKGNSAKEKPSRSSR